jgi:hypothetical protein
MHASQHYRDCAAECLLAAQEAFQPHRRKLHLSMAISWLSLARQYEGIERLFQGTGEAALTGGTKIQSPSCADQARIYRRDGFCNGADDPSGHDDFPSSTYAFVLRQSLDRTEIEFPAKGLGREG